LVKNTRGMSKVISISKIRKINLIIKKWVLNGVWLFDIGSNPHSNGDDFSRSFIIFFEIKKLININIKEIIISKEVIINSWIIIYINLVKFFNWKLNVINILYKYKCICNMWVWIWVYGV